MSGSGRVQCRRKSSSAFYLTLKLKPRPSDVKLKSSDEVPFLLRRLCPTSSIKAGLFLLLWKYWYASTIFRLFTRVKNWLNMLVCAIWSYLFKSSSSSTLEGIISFDEWQVVYLCSYQIEKEDVCTVTIEMARSCSVTGHSGSLP